MRRTLRVFQVDAFTQTPFTGNPATVVLDGEGLSDEQMRAVAREFAKGDAAFVLPATAPDHDLCVRFFMPDKEAPFVGHATLAVHAVLARQAPQPVRRQSGRSGIVEVRALDDGSFAISQPPPALAREPQQHEMQALLPLLGLEPADLDAACPPRIAGTASTRLIIALRDIAALDALRPQLPQLAAMSATLGAHGYFLFTRSGSRAGCLTESRMFCPALGIDEDPVSGNAHAMLAVLLQERGLLPSAGGCARFTGAQGRHVGRPGRVDVSLELDPAGRPLAVSISGQAVVVLEGSAVF
ncbi:MAG TPA: PhzF family phenazine biosynthesis isomerase [Steroidobacteraceae bacterium]|nr:PhzF family phenazine biosynthesis isomerase [Steroidobacteraceae bacterium]